MVIGAMVREQSRNLIALAMSSGKCAAVNRRLQSNSVENNFFCELGLWAGSVSALGVRAG